VIAPLVTAGIEEADDGIGARNDRGDVGSLPSIAGLATEGEVVLGGLTPVFFANDVINRIAEIRNAFMK
jgi:hypothetical protein